MSKSYVKVSEYDVNNHIKINKSFKKCHDHVNEAFEQNSHIKNK